MKRSLRSACGVFMLAALGLSLAEGAWAARCALQMEVGEAMAGMSMAGMEMPMPEGSTGPVDAHGPHCGATGHHEEPPSNSSGDAQECPLGLPSGSCVSTVTLPSTTVNQLTSFFENDNPTVAPEVHPHSVQEHAVFHPPKA